MPRLYGREIVLGSGGGISLSAPSAPAAPGVPGSETLFAGAGADDAAVGTTVWSFPENITADDGAFASAANVNTLGTSHYLKATSFGFAVPAGAAIVGVEVVIKKQKALAGTAVDDVVRLVKGGVVSGDNKADGVTPYPTSAAPSAVTYGGASDLWGLALTDSDVNAADFGVVLSVRETGSGSQVRPQIDYVQITVHYTT